MSSPPDLTIDWLGASEDARLPLLRHFGLRVEPAAAPDAGALFVLPLRRWNGRALPASAVGGLLLVDDAEQEAQWLAQMPPRIEVVREPASALLLHERLRRLAAAQGEADAATAWSAAAPLDPLTGCLSRTGWTRLLQQRMAQPGADVNALLLLDLDGFRAFNEQHGHAAGDRALAELAAQCRLRLAGHDVLGRWGGDEFALLLRRYDADSLLADARALLGSLAGLPLARDATRPWSHWLRSSAEAIRLPSASAGLAWLQPERSFAALLAEADSALQRARQRGRGLLEHASLAPAGAPRSAAQDDALTQMGNRAHCDARLAREISSAEREARPLALWLVDLRGLAGLNAEAGFAQGDAALARLAQQLRAQARLTDWCARVRPSALLLVMPHTETDGARQASARLEAAVAGLGLALSSSLVQHQRGDSAAALLERAWQQRRPLGEA